MIGTLQSRRRLRFAALGVASFVIGTTAGWIPLAARIDNYHYDWTLNLYRPSEPAREAMLLAFDDRTAQAHRGIRGLRATLTQALQLTAKAQPRAVAIDLILAEDGDPAEDMALAKALAATPNLVMASEIARDSGRWVEPYKLFQPYAKAIGHVHADLDRYDGVSRQVQLEKVVGHDRRWAMALETYRLAHSSGTIVESPKDLQLGKQIIPVARTAEGRAMLIRYRSKPVDTLSVAELLSDPGKAEKMRGRTIFVGVTAHGQVRDHWVTPYTTTMPMPGVEIHAHIYETLAQGAFLRKASPTAVVLVSVLLTAATTLAFAFLGGWHAYVVALLQIAMAHALPHAVFGDGVIFPLLAPAGCVWLAGLSCAGYQHFVVRRQLDKSEADRTRYQQAIHFVTHEMKSPLTTIQGSSELMTRYNLSDEKRKQIAQMINSESKRLARMIENFLNLERLSDGSTELKRESFAMQDLIIVSTERARQYAQRKSIQIEVGELTEAHLLGDRELMEYAIYNLLTNAVKYSPPETQVFVDARRNGEFLRVSIKDQGIGMDEKELKKIFTKFYRTRRAEQSGEAGTGIGLSIVSQIVEHHGGRIEVTSAPNRGSTFTLVVPAGAN